MYHYFDAVRNTNGPALIGYFVKAVSTTTGSVVDIFADENGTAIEVSSGVSNAAEVDSNGNVSFYIPGGTYHLDYYATDGTTFVLREENVQMVDFATLSTTGIGYAVGAGGTVTQLTSKSTGVTLNTLCGQITTHNASLAAGTAVLFPLTNSKINWTDNVVVNLQSAGGGAHGIPEYTVRCGQIDIGSCSILVKNESGGALAESLIINFSVVKGVNA